MEIALMIGNSGTFFGTKADQPISDRELLKFYRGSDVIYGKEQALTAPTGSPR